MGALADVAEDLSAFERRAACSDAERRAALWLHDELRERGHEAWVETVWVRPAWGWSLFWHALLGVGGSLVATEVPVAGLVLCAVALLSFTVGRTGRDAMLERLMVRRATQVVLVEPADPEAVAVWVHAATDAPRAGAVYAFRRLGAALRPGPFGWVLLALIAVTAVAALRVAGVDSPVLSWAALVPSIVLLLALAAGVDAALAGPGPGSGETAGVAAALEVFEDLRADPPPGTAPALVLAGAGELSPLGLRAWLRDARPDPARTLLVDVGPAGAGSAVAWTARRPQLRAAFAAAGRRRRINRPAVANLRRLPVVNVRAVDGRGAVPRVAGVDEAAARAVAEAAVAGVRGLELQPVRSRAKATNQS